MRKYLAESGTDDEKKIADDCDLGTLIELAKRRLSFKKRGAKIKTLFDVLFGFSPWPSKEAHQTILDLALLRNIFVHVGTPVPGEYAEHAWPTRPLFRDHIRRPSDDLSRSTLPSPVASPRHDSRHENAERQSSTGTLQKRRVAGTPTPDA